MIHKTLRCPCGRLECQRAFEGLLATDSRLEVAPGTTPQFGLTCFQLRSGGEEESAALLEAVNASGACMYRRTAEKNYRRCVHVHC